MHPKGKFSNGVLWRKPLAGAVNGLLGYVVEAGKAVRVISREKFYFVMNIYLQFAM